MQWSALLQFVLTGLTQGSIYALVAVGFNLVYSATGIINFAQGEFVMLGGLLAVTCYTTLHLPLALAVILPIGVVMLVGAGIHRFAIRPLRQAHLVTLIMVTVGVSVALRGLAQVIWGADSYPLPPFSHADAITLGGASLDPQSLWVLGIAAITGGGLTLFFRYTTAGRAMTACALSPLAARLSGIRVERMNTWAFALAGGVGAIAGAVLAPIALPSFDVGTSLALKGFCAAILGGIGNNTGALLGGLLVGLMESLGAGYISSGYKDAIAFLALLIVLVLRPSGLLNVALRRDDR
jgi:branched-chain amino acid transport system permease protein